MSRSVSAPSLVTNTSPCWNGFIVPGSTFRYGSSFCIVTRNPRAFSNEPRLDAVRPLPSDDATPPVTNRCLEGRWLDASPGVRSTEVHANTKGGSVWSPWAGGSHSLRRVGQARRVELVEEAGPGVGA